MKKMVVRWEDRGGGSILKANNVPTAQVAMVDEFVFVVTVGLNKDFISPPAYSTLLKAQQAVEVELGVTDL